jgi:hypothetical protein
MYVFTFQIVGEPTEMNSLEPDPVRQLVVATLAELGSPPADGALEERVLHRDPVHCGRRFQYRSIRAVWFVDSPAVDFFTDEGDFLTSVPVDPAGQA